MVSSPYFQTWRVQAGADVLALGTWCRTYPKTCTVPHEAAGSRTETAGRSAALLLEVRLISIWPFGFTAAATAATTTCGPLLSLASPSLAENCKERTGWHVGTLCGSPDPAGDLQRLLQGIRSAEGWLFLCSMIPQAKAQPKSCQ